MESRINTLETQIDALDDICSRLLQTQLNSEHLTHAQITTNDMMIRRIMALEALQKTPAQKTADRLKKAAERTRLKTVKDAERARVKEERARIKEKRARIKEKRARVEASEYSSDDSSGFGGMDGGLY